VHEPDGFDNMNKSDEDISGDEEDGIKIKGCLIDMGELAI
jgi:hypothetical protein